MNDFSGKRADKNVIVLKRMENYMANYTSTLFKKSKKLNKILVLISILVLTVILSLNNFNPTNVFSHSSYASPTEMFSLWNDTAPTIDGLIGFTPNSLSGEWSSAAVYDLFDNTNNPDGKIIIQNDNSYSYVALDGTSFLVEEPGGVWGASIGIDTDHDGILSSNDYSIGFVKNSTGSYVELRQAVNGIWKIIEYGVPGTPLSGSGMLVDTSFEKSAFNNDSQHRQYEFRIPYASTPVSPGDILGVGFELYNSEIALSKYHVWPYVGSNPKLIRVSASYWGDLHLGEESTYSKYVVEDNFNVRGNYVGYNNGTFLTKADINGDGDQELVALSNRTVTGQENLIAIFDYKNGEITSIWESWLSGHYSSLTFQIKQIAAFDFDENGEDELYLIGDSTSIFRLFDWDIPTGDFQSIEIAYDNEGKISSIAIGSALHYIGMTEIVYTDEYGTYNVLVYDDKKDDFNRFDWYTLPDIDSLSVSDILDVEVADFDDDNWEEILLLSQYDTDKSTGLQIREIDVGGTPEEYDNPTDHPLWGYEDFLPEDSHSNTYDISGHSIVVGDVDNDGYNETIIVGRDYIRIFSPYEFNATTVPFELNLNDGTAEPKFAGGAGILDIDNDNMNELIVGCNNGTTIVYEIENTLSGSEYDSFTITEEWRGDLGASPGAWCSIIGLDIDEDGDVEAIIGDNFGQIIVLGIGTKPSITITSPIDGYSSNRDTILLGWEIDNSSLQIHHYDITINDTLIVRSAGGSQTNHYLHLGFGTNNINITCIDIRGESDWDVITVYYNPGLPEVTITSPSDYYISDTQTVRVEYTGVDPQSDSLTYYIYVNSSFPTYTTTESYYDVVLPSEGLWNITVVGRDSGGDQGKDRVYVTYDNSGPFIEITSPLDGSAHSSSTIEVNWDAWDDYSSIEYFDIYLDTILQGNTTSNHYNLDIFVDKAYTIKVYAYDILGHLTIDSITIIRDTVNPSVDLLELSYPTTADGHYYTDNPDIFIEWLGNDNSGGSGLEYFEVRVDEVPYGVYAPISINDTVTLTIEGLNKIEIYAYDFAGNFAFDFYYVAYDISDPTVSITSPYDGYITSADNVTVIWNADDIGSGIKNIDVIVDGITEASYTDPSITSYVVDLSTDKNYTIIIQVTDYLDRIATDTINVTHDQLVPTLYITEPLDVNSYTCTPLITVKWDSILITASEYIVYINETTEYHYGPAIFEAQIDLSDIFDSFTLSQYPVVNITLVSVEATPNHFDTRFITVDLTKPTLSIYNPINMSLDLDGSLDIEWLGNDVGSAIESYTMWINSSLIGSWGSGISTETVDVSGYQDGIYNITIQAFDIAGNNISKTVFVSIFPVPPEFTIDIPLTILTNNPDFVMTVTVFDPRQGIKEIAVLVDGTNVVFYESYNESILIPTVWPIPLVEDDFVVPIDNHNISITVSDEYSRGSNVLVNIIIDQSSPTLFSSPILGDRILGSNGNSIEMSHNETDILNFRLSANDTYGISDVQLLVFNENHSFSYTMDLNLGQSIGDVYVFDKLVNFDSYTAGNYTIQFIITDNAGNTLSQLYSLSVSIPQPVDPNGPDNPSNPNWFLENLYTIIIPSAGGVLFLILFSTFLSLATRKRRQNRGWKEALEAVAFVTKTGLTLAYVPYCKDLFEDEQLFGGALTGVVGILGEITGETEVQMQVHVLEFGDKRLLVCSGYFGNAILLVNDVKPILNDLIKKFLMEFELTYKIQLAQELIDLNEFSAVPLMVESIFGFREQFLRDTLEQYKEEHLTFEQQPVYEEQPQYPQDEYQQQDDQQQQPYDQEYNQDQNHDLNEY